MSDLARLGHEFTVWLSNIVGYTCPSCGRVIEYESRGMVGGQAAHRVECACTVIETRGK